MNIETMMKYKGFYARIMEAERLTGDHTHGLPPGTPLPVYCSNIFKEYPTNWMVGPGVFVVPVQPNKGLWFDWSMNNSDNTAVLPTVKGCNPITGQQTSGYHLERYDNKCPKHGKEFGPDRFCEECGYKWPFGNYVAAPNVLWLDTWFNNGHGRQFFFTEDEVRDIATKMIGKDNTVPAFGFAFYRPKVERPRSQVQYNVLYENTLFKTLVPPYKSFYYSNTTGGCTLGEYNYSATYNSNSCGETLTSDGRISESDSDGGEPDSDIMCAAAPAAPVQISKMFRSAVRMDYQPKKEVAIGAGAKISQDLIEDPYPLDTWKDTPDSVMTIYFVFKEEVDRMLSKGVVDTTEKPEGMLEGLPVG